MTSLMQDVQRYRGSMDSQDVIAIVHDLEYDRDAMDLRADIKRREEQHALTDLPWLPDHMTRGITAVMPSVEPAYLAQVIGADMASYISQTTVVPGNPDLQNKADKVEKRYALERAELFTQRNVARVRWSQFIRGYGIYKLNCGGVDEKHPWSLVVPDPLSCFFPIAGGVRLSMVGRRYDQLVRKIEGDKAFIDQRKGQRPKYNGEKWGWEPISEDMATDDSGWLLERGRKGVFEKVSFVELDTGTKTYCVAMNKDDRTGEVVWERGNLTGGCAYVIVPGHLTDSRKPREFVLPYLWPAMNEAAQISLLDTIRLTRSLNIKPQVLIERDPNLLQPALAMGILQPAGQSQEVTPDTMIDVDGTPHFWQTPDDKDLEMLEQRAEARLARYSSTQLSLTTGEVVANVTVRGLQLAMGARQRQQGPMLGYNDEAQAEVLRMWRHSICCEGGYGADKWGLYSKGPEMYSKGETKTGDYAEITKADLEFDHDISVYTASMTREEKQLAVDGWSQRKAARLSTWLEGIDAAGYADQEAQVMALAEDEAYEIAGQLAGPNIVSRIFEASMRERAGIYIQVVPPMPTPMAAPTGSSGNLIAPPPTEGASGGSGAQEVAQQPMQGQ